jgi:hypothetical protein
MAREFVGLRVKFMNAQTGARGKVKPVRGKEEQQLLRGESAFNCFAEKSKVIADCTPLMAGDDGVEALAPGEPENDDVVVDWYEVVYDGKAYRGDAIQNTDIEVNNHEANHGLTPRLVFGPGISGNHTLTFRASVNGHVDEADFVLKLNG